MVIVLMSRSRTSPEPPEPAAEAAGGRGQRTAFNLGIYFLSQVTNALLALVLLGILARALGRAGFGEFSFAFVVASMGALIADFGLGPWLTRSAAQRPAASASLLKQVLRARMGLTAIAWAIVLSASTLYLQDSRRVAGIALMLAYVTASGYVAVYESLLMGRQRAGGVAASVVGGKLLELAAVLTWLGLTGHLDVPDAAAALSIACGIRVIIVWQLSRALLARGVPPETAAAALLPGQRALLRDALPFALGAIAWTAYFKVDVLILERLTTAEKLGLYTAAYRVLEALTLIPRSVVGVSFPVIAASWNGKTLEKGILDGPCRGLTAAGLACAAGIWVVSEDALRLLFGPAFVDGAGVLRVLAIAMPLLFLNQFLGMALSASHRQADWVRVILAAFAVNVVANLILIPAAGIEGAAWATLLSEAVSLALLGTLVARRHGGLPRPAWLGRAALAAAGMGILVHFLPLALILRVGVGSIVFLALAALLRVFTPGEWALALNTARRLPLVFTRSPVEGYLP